MITKIIAYKMGKENTRFKIKGAPVTSEFHMREGCALATHPDAPRDVKQKRRESHGGLRKLFSGR